MISLERTGAELIEILKWLKENDIECSIQFGKNNLTRSLSIIEVEEELKSYKEKTSSPKSLTKWATDKVHLVFEFPDADEILFKLTWQ